MWGPNVVHILLHFSASFPLQKLLVFFDKFLIWSEGPPDSQRQLMHYVSPSKCTGIASMSAWFCSLLYKKCILCLLLPWHCKAEQKLIGIDLQFYKKLLQFLKKLFLYKVDHTLLTTKLKDNVKETKSYLNTLDIVFFLLMQGMCLIFSTTRDEKNKPV